MSNVNLSSGIPETILPTVSQELLNMLESAKSSSGNELEEISKVLQKYPTSIDAWACYGSFCTDTMASYAAYRVGYHRGLDQLRKNGWRGSGYVKWQHVSNQGFLTALNGLRKYAEKINEADEATRCRDFLAQLDPELDINSIS